MVIQFQLPTDVEQNLHLGVEQLNTQAKEALLVSLYRQGQISHRAFSLALGLDRLEAEELLRKHNVVEDLGTVEEHLAEVRAVDELRSAGR